MFNSQAQLKGVAEQGERVWTTWLQPKTKNPTKKINIKLYVLYVLNTYIKFHTNQILFTILSINLFFYA